VAIDAVGEDRITGGGRRRMLSHDRIESLFGIEFESPESRAPAGAARHGAQDFQGNSARPARVAVQTESIEQARPRIHPHHLYGAAPPGAAHRKRCADGGLANSAWSQ